MVAPSFWSLTIFVPRNFRGFLLTEVTLPPSFIQF
jgi:hypothetical protein